MLSGRRFYFRPVLTIFTALGLAALISLGVWQLHRLEWKRALIAKVEARTHAPPIPFSEALQRAQAGEDMEYTPVTVEGVFDNDLEARVFGTYDGAPGVYVFAPLGAPAADDGRTFVYVNRGFAPQAFADPKTRSDSEISGETVVRGLFRSPERPAGLAKLFSPGEKETDGLWFLRDPALFSAAAGVSAPPWYIDSFAVAGGKWPKGGTTRLAFRNKHKEYALTWFGLAAALFVIWIIFSLQSPSETNNFKK